MKNIIKLFTFAALTFSLVAITSCTKNFEEINTDNDNPGIKQAAPNMLLTNAIESMTDRVHEIFLGHEMGSCWVQQMAKVQYTDEDRYIFRPSVVNNSWRSFYAASGNDIQTIYNIGNKNYKGVALVMKCYIGSVLTDLFGPVPYTKAWQGVGALLPAYDSQESIYRLMIAQLDSANSYYLDQSGTAIAGDILFNNNILKWKKFANSLRLRLLLRMSGKDANFVTTEMTKMVNDATTYPLFESSADNASLQYLGSAPNNNPINENRKTRDDHRVSKQFVDLMSAYGDYRLMVFANPATETDQFVGLPNGLTSSDAAGYLGNGLTQTCKMGDYFVQATAPGQLMNYAELQFILAEAAVKGFISGGMAQAKTYYDAGITGSFDQYSVPLQAIFTANWGGAFGSLPIDSGYTVAQERDFHINDATAPAYFSLTLTQPEALQKIAEQRYIANFDLGLEAWFEWRRTGFPVLTAPIAGTNDGKIPIRVPYPSDETATNPSSLAAGIVLLGGPDGMNTPVWWETK
ncbi:MAG: SusD/RagB family nutrient-binding outer membrane lipoprotein [Bacteroidota bacterium]